MLAVGLSDPPLMILAEIGPHWGSLAMIALALVLFTERTFDMATSRLERCTFDHA